MELREILPRQLFLKKPYVQVSSNNIFFVAIHGVFFPHCKGIRLSNIPTSKHVFFFDVFFFEKEFFDLSWDS